MSRVAGSRATASSVREGHRTLFLDVGADRGVPINEGSAPARRGTWRAMARAGVLHRIAREPLARFVVLGAVIFAADRAIGSRADERVEDPRRIVISERFVEGLRARHRERTGSDPSADEEAGLVRAWAREEALEREARAASLDAGDAIVRRRLVQKIEFVIAGTVLVPEPSEEDLRAWMNAHRAAIAIPARTTLEHVFFSRQERGERAADDAQATLSGLAAESADIDPGARRSLSLRLADRPRDRCPDRRRPRPGVAERIREAPIGRWTAPVEGALGAHLIRVRARDPERLPALDEVRDRVRAAWVEERRQEETSREIERIVAGYEIVRVEEP